MKIAAIIPSRYGSSRFEGKPLAPIAGVPMIQRVYQRIQQAGCITDIAVSTDDRRIHEVVTGFGGRCLITSNRCRTGSDRAAETAGLMALADDDIVVNIQGDQPLIAPETIEETVAPLLSQPSGMDIATAVCAMDNPAEIEDPGNVKAVFDRQGFALYFSRSPIPSAREKNTVFATYKHLGIYAYTKRFLDTYAALPDGVLEQIEKLEQLRALEYGHRIKVVTTGHDSPSVDTPEDIKRIEARLS